MLSGDKDNLYTHAAENLKDYDIAAMLVYHGMLCPIYNGTINGDEFQNWRYNAATARRAQKIEEDYTRELYTLTKKYAPKECIVEIYGNNDEDGYQIRVIMANVSNPYTSEVRTILDKYNK